MDELHREYCSYVVHNYSQTIDASIVLHYPAIPFHMGQSENVPDSVLQTKGDEAALFTALVCCCCNLMVLQGII